MNVLDHRGLFSWDLLDFSRSQRIALKERRKGVLDVVRVYTEENEPEQENVDIFSYSKCDIFIYHIIQNQITSYLVQLRRWA